MSRSSPKSGPEGPRSKDLGYTLDFSWAGVGFQEGYIRGNLRGTSRDPGVFKRVLKLDLEVDFRGDFKQELVGDELSISGQLRSRSGLVQFRAQI